MTSPWTPTFEPLFVVLGGGALWAYARAARRGWPGRARAAAFGAGLLLIVVGLNSPLETIAVDYLVLFHLLQNVIISDWAPPLLILGLTPAMQSAIAERGGRPFAFLTRPTIALPIWLVGWYAVHLGGVYDAALRQPASS
jgi:cytochrome c oxidase assembly factor CtaG